MIATLLTANVIVVMWIGGWTLYVAEPGYRVNSAQIITGLLSFLSVFWWLFFWMLWSAVPS